MANRKLYAQIAIKTSIADDDGVIKDSKYKTIIIQSNEASDLMNESSERVREQIRESTNILINRMDDKNF